MFSQAVVSTALSTSQLKLSYLQYNLLALLACAAYWLDALALFSS